MAEEVKKGKLTNGLIPKHTECPFKQRCGFFEGCPHLGVDHKVDFSCASARAFDLVERHKK